MFIAPAIGGDALSGHEAGGRYYLADHGTLTEVSRTVFLYSLSHSILTIATWVLMIPTMWALRRQRPIS